MKKILAIKLKKKECIIKRISAVKNHMEEMTARKSSGKKKDKNDLTKNEVPSATVQPACQFNLPMEKRREISQNRCLVFLWVFPLFNGGR